MTEHKLFCLNKIIRYKAFSDRDNSFLSAVYHQARLLHLLVKFRSLQELQTEFTNRLLEKELYAKLPVRHDTQVLRLLSRYLKVAISIHYSSGYQQTFPYQYLLNEPTINLISLNEGYGSIVEVNKTCVNFTDQVFTHKTCFRYISRCLPHA